MCCTLLHEFVRTSGSANTISRGFFVQGGRSSYQQFQRNAVMHRMDCFAILYIMVFPNRIGCHRLTGPESSVEVETVDR